MTDELAQISDILAWVGDEPFRLFAALCLFVAVVTFLFFRNEHPAYKVFAVILLFIGAGGIGLSAVGGLEVPEATTDDPARTTASSGLQMVQKTISASIDNVRHTGSCVEAYASKVAAIANNFPNDPKVKLANDIVQMELSTKHYLDKEFPSSIAPCGNSPLVGRGFTPSCQPGADAFYQIKLDIIAGKLIDAKINADTANAVLKSCKEA